MQAPPFGSSLRLMEYCFQATVVTTYTRGQNGSHVPIDSTTIPRPSSELLHTFGYLANMYAPSIPGVPTDLLSDYGGDPHNYAATSFDTDIAVTFTHTDLVITQPTPFDKWMRIGIYTETPDPSLHSSGDFSTWPASICGTYDTYTGYSWASQTVGTGITKSLSYSSSPTATYTQLQPSDPSNYLYFPMGAEYGEGFALLNATFIQTRSTRLTEAKMQVPFPTGIIDWLATQEEVIKEYPYIRNCWLGPEGEGQPTVHVPVMALTVTSSVFRDATETPTVKSSEKGSAASLSTKSTIHTIVTVKTSTTPYDASTTASVRTEKSASEVAGPESAGSPQSEGEELDSNTDVANPTSTTQLGEEVKHSPISGSVSREPDMSEEQHTMNNEEGQSGNPVNPAMSSKPQSTVSSTAEVIGGLASAIQSVVVQQGGASKDSFASADNQRTTRVVLAAAASTAVSDERPAESVTGYAIGTQTASPGGEAVTRGGSVYSALPSGSGLMIVADGQTSRFTDAVMPGVAIAQGSGSDNDYIVGDNALTAGGPAITSDGNTISALPAGSGVRIAASGQTKIIPAAAFTGPATLRSGGSEDEYIFAGKTISVGDQGLAFAGVTYSALRSGSGIIIIAEDSTSTLGVGQAVGTNFASGSDLDSPSLVILPAGSQDLSTGTDIYTISGIIYTSDGTVSATDAAITGGTKSSNITDSVSGTVSSTHGLGDAIMSGIGGGNADDGDGDANIPDASQSTDVEAASHAVRRSVHVMLCGFCTFAFAFAFALL